MQVDDRGRGTLSDEELRSLAESLRLGDVAAFERVFLAFHAPLCEVVDSLVNSQDVAEDIVQDLFVALWAGRGRLVWRGSPRGYLFTAARNRALQHLRHRATVARTDHRTAAETEIAGVGEPPFSPQTVLELGQLAADVRAAMDALPPRTRVAAVLRWQYAFSYKEVAEAMGISVKGVEKLIGIACGQLRSRLNAYSPRADDGAQISGESR